MTDNPPQLPPQVPGESLQLPDTDLLQNIGRYLSLYEHEQKKRIVLIQAYNELKTEFDTLKASLEHTNVVPAKYDPEDVIQGMP